jgi:hypothetical protein
VRNYRSGSSTGCPDGRRSCQLRDPQDWTAGSVAAQPGPPFNSSVTTLSGNAVSSDAGIYIEDYFFNSTLVRSLTLASTYIHTYIHAYISGAPRKEANT